MDLRNSHKRRSTSTYADAPIQGSGLSLALPLSSRRCLGLSGGLKLLQVLAILSVTVALVHLVAWALGNLEGMHLLELVLLVVEDVRHDEDMRTNKRKFCGW